MPLCPSIKSRQTPRHCTCWLCWERIGQGEIYANQRDVVNRLNDVGLQLRDRGPWGDRDRLAHNSEVAGWNPVPATRKTAPEIPRAVLVLGLPCRAQENEAPPRYAPH